MTGLAYFTGAILASLLAAYGHQEFGYWVLGTGVFVEVLIAVAKRMERLP